MSVADRSMREKGFALITVLWITAFLIVIASAVSYQSRSSLKLATNVVTSLKTRHAAEGALLLTTNKLIGQDESLNLALQKNVFNYQFDDIQITVNVADESGKIDINLAPIELLNSLFIVLGLDEKSSASISSAIADWRDEDNLKRLNGAEDQEYIARGLPYQAKDDEFDNIDEVSLVLGMNTQLYNRVEPYITVHALDLGVNTTLASPIVKNAVNNIYSDSSGQNSLDDYVTATGRLIYTLHAKAKASNGITSSITAIIRLQRGNLHEPFTILGWKTA